MSTPFSSSRIPADHSQGQKPWSDMTKMLCHRFSAKKIILLILFANVLTGCSLPRWANRQPVCVLDPTISKEDLVSHLNRYVHGNEELSELHSWRSDNVTMRLDGVGFSFPIPAKIAVDAPHNFRLLVSNPMTRGQEADIGSNDERFWVWTKQTREIMTAKHEDVSVVLQEMQFPVHVHPEWLMEVFGVLPLEASQFEMTRPRIDTGEVELVSTQKSSIGEDIERVITVNVCSGRIQKHSLRLPGGKVIAFAVLDKYERLPSGYELPSVISLHWPDAQMKMVMQIQKIEANPANLAHSSTLWQLPEIAGSRPVDLGVMARQSAMSRSVLPAQHEHATTAKPNNQGPLGELAAPPLRLQGHPAQRPTWSSASLEDAPAWTTNQ